MQSTVMTTTAKELRSGSFKRCPSVYGLPGSYLNDAEEQRRSELRRRRSTTTATTAAKRGRQPEHLERDRVIKMGPT